VIDLFGGEIEVGQLCDVSHFGFSQLHFRGRGALFSLPYGLLQALESDATAVRAI
jgi:hypothetical protein